MSIQTNAIDDQPQGQQAKKSRVSKTDLVLRSLGRKAGASVDDLCKLTNWQAHSVRGFLSGTVRKKLGLEITRRKDAKGVTRYNLVKPEPRS